MANAVVTQRAKTKMLKARSGAIALPKIVGMAFGNGGVDSSGNVIAPSENQNSLNGELFRKAIDGYEIMSDTKCKYTCTLLSDEATNSYLSEIALYDEDGDLVAIKNFTKRAKGSDLEITFCIYDEIL